MPKRNLESGLQKQIIQYLELKGYYVQRMNSGKQIVNVPGGRSRMISMCKAGTSDILAIQPDTGRACWFEVKMPGKKLTDLQVDFVIARLADGCIAGRVESIECVDRLIKEQQGER